MTPGEYISDMHETRRRNLRDLMKMINMTNREAAKLFGLSPQHVSKLLCGHFNIDEARARIIESELRLPYGYMDHDQRQ